MSSIEYDINQYKNKDFVYAVNKLKPNEINELYDLISLKINHKFVKLNLNHKKLLKKYIHHVCLICAFYFQMENAVEQFGLNNGQDIFSIGNMIWPYFELTKCGDIQSLDEIFLNKSNKASVFESTYYVDHEYLKSDPKYLETYFENNLKSLEATFSKTCSKLLPNWLNILPYTMNNYKSSNLYKNYIYLRNFSAFTLDDQLIYTNNNLEGGFIYNSIVDKNYCLLGYNCIYGCMYNFLYNDIKTIKWMIFDKVYNKIVYPNIIILGELLQIKNIANTKWEQLDWTEKTIIYDCWVNLIKTNDNIDLIKSLIIFYLRYEYDQNKLNRLKLDKKCISLLKNKIKFNTFENDEEDEVNIYTNTEELDKCVLKISNQIKVEDIYNYIYTCIQRFRYTWYGFKCLDSDSNILSLKNFIENLDLGKSSKKSIPSEITDNFDFIYITLKNIYNFFKSSLHHSYLIEGKSEYKLISNSPSWDSLDYESKKIFIDRLNFTGDGKSFDTKNEYIRETSKWFNIRRNLKRIYQNDSAVNKIHTMMVENFVLSNVTSDVIFETLVLNGMLSYFKFNPKATDSKLMPDKNTDLLSWRKYILNQVNITPYSESYNFLSNKKISTIPNYFELVKNSLWYTNFGGNWVAQLQMFYHLINQRLLMITGATGAGKSTVAPFMILYGLKILNFDNNVKIICTQPRKQPTEDNTERIAQSLGFPIKDSSKQMIDYNITYIQLKHSDKSIVDDEYHPCLRIVTDGTLVNMLKESYMLKKPNMLKNNDFIKSNLFNCILVDEAHEHNANMDMILTIMRLATYINNQLTLGIISATMDEDEPRYRKYYQMIDDNWRWPLNLNYLPEQAYQKKNYDSNLLDRRIHLSPPFATTNFRIDENTVISKESQDKVIVQIINNIIRKSPTGDILVFQNGQSEIIKLVDKINSSTPINVLAVPFYSELNAELLDNYIKNIANKEIRKKINIKKNVPITKFFDLNQDEKVDEGTYTRFIIVATNIAEASITIDTLKFVIDNGTQKNNIYDPNRDTSNLKVDYIADPNRKQRKGRVGRVAPGMVYYLYDINKLRKDVIFKICIQNITTTILDLLSTNETKLLNRETDPYLTDSLDKIPEFLQNQYSWINKITGLSTLYSNKKNINIYPIYPNSDGKYDSSTIIDPDGKFYLIHPNEDNFVRDKELNIIERINYVNKPERIIEYNKTKNIIDSDNKLTSYGQLIVRLEDLLMTGDTKYINLLLDLMSFKIPLTSKIFNNIILFVIFKKGNYSFGKSRIKGKSDLLLKIEMIPEDFLNKIDILLDIIPKLDSNFENLDSLINYEMSKNKFKESIEAYSSVNTKTIMDIIKIYYLLKIKLVLIILIQPVLNKLRENKLIGREIDYEKRNEIVNSFDKLSKDLLQIIENNDNIIKINLSDNIQYPNNLRKEFLDLNDYDKTFVLILKNFPYNLIQKVSSSDFYIEYFNRDVNRIYRINSFSPPYAPTKIIKNTLVDVQYLNNLLYFMNSDDTYAVSNLSLIPTNIIRFVKKMIPYKMMIVKNKKINKEYCYEIYGNQYNKILEKIDKIMEII